MDQRRTIAFITLSMGILLLWQAFVIPRFLPQRKPAADGAVEQALADAPWAEPAVSALAPANLPAAAVAAPAQVVVEQHPQRDVVLGSLDPASPFFAQYTLSSQGASITSAVLNDPRYCKLSDPKSQLQLLGTGDERQPHSLNLRLLGIEAAASAQLDKINWEIVQGSESPESVQFRAVLAEPRLEVRKTYRLQPADVTKVGEKYYRDTHFGGYQLGLTVDVRNLGSAAQTVAYRLQGPVGVPLEDPENATKYQDVRLGFLRPNGKEVDASVVHAKDVVAKVQQEKPEVWTRPLRYIGVDVQYFAALLAPQGDQVNKPYTESSSFELIRESRQRVDFSELSIVLNSIPLELGPAGRADDRVSHDYSLYLGPKRPELLTPLQADAIIDFGWFSMVSVSMLWLLNTLNSVGINYGIAIILLTCIVRSCLLPLTIKQTASMQKMKDLQPKIKDLQKKYANDREGMAKAQMELFREHNANPLAGCLPVFLQLPIFIGLYRALNGSVDLRQASFLWIDNLAGPDSLFQLPFRMPFFEWTEFNLLPILTIALFVVQQKVTMPPPTDPEQALQFKMMNYMMIGMGVMFYRVASGLCVYFIASSCWGLAERWLLDKYGPAKKSKLAEAALATTPTASPATTALAAPKDKPATGLGQLWNQLLEAADKQGQAARPSGSEMSPRGNNNRKKSKR